MAAASPPAPAEVYSQGQARALLRNSFVMPRPLHMGIKDLLCAQLAPAHHTPHTSTPPRENLHTVPHRTHRTHRTAHRTATPHHTSTPRPSRTSCESSILAPPGLAPPTPPPPHAHSRPQPISPSVSHRSNSPRGKKAEKPNVHAGAHARPHEVPHTSTGVTGEVSRVFCAGLHATLHRTPHRPHSSPPQPTAANHACRCARTAARSSSSSRDKTKKRESRRKKVEFVFTYEIFSTFHRG